MALSCFMVYGLKGKRRFSVVLGPFYLLKPPEKKPKQQNKKTVVIDSV